MSDDRRQAYHGSKSTNGRTAHEEATQLTDLLHNLRAFNPADPSSSQDIGQLLKSLEQADGIAKGVDSRLDTLLQDLEGMIGKLEAERAEGRTPGREEESGIEELKEEVETQLASDIGRDPSSSEDAAHRKS
ncbi:hypothetical protein CALVIDRAFT_534993 [Calocera viscosa TUFC12733]|uniref:Uncharacterized protein n=1 Tax=Calocera viscosa (strain TUFC12733) TaxID=1330018 RepID=A0A167PKM9_CALVF|nr:hypothetical protein CALVIDRAFT_534993 [Calocera viscosa TUFC12733]